MFSNQANATFHTRHATNQMTGNKIHNKGFNDVLSELPTHHTVNAQNNKADIQIQIHTQMKIFPKNDHRDTSFGALSNIATSGFTVSGFLIQPNQIWPLQIWGTFHKSVII